MYSISTDLAVEAKEYIEEQSKSKISGVDYVEKVKDDVKIATVTVATDEGAKTMGRPKGTYITIDIPSYAHYDSDTMDILGKAMAAELTPLIKLKENETALVVGLGNRMVTPDALGPKVVSKLMITRHLKQLVPESIDEGIRPVCAIAPGVLGTTGIETLEVIKGVVERVKPNLIICIDALASRKMDRVNSTIQIGTSGISPGAGIGNHRLQISEEALGIPVIAIGVPTVVHATTLAHDTIELVLNELIANATEGSNFYTVVNGLNERNEELINEVLTPRFGDLVVTPKEVDLIIESLSKIIANGVNISLQPALDQDDINRYLN